MGFIETLLILKKRGILLAIVSKNNEEFILANWDHLVQGRIAPEDFAVRKINFRSKVENLLEVLQEINLRPQNTVMIDDNPTERAAIRAGLPEVRVLGSHPYYLKRILLWSAETQRCAITRESGQKTEMVHAQLQRESVRKSLSHEEFLKTLELRVTLSRLRETRDFHMSRALELFNKTNQFNTTGERYTLEECHRNFAAGRELYVIEAQDRFTQYGLIGAAWVWQNCVIHLVMSCRALGLGIEDAFLSHLANRLIRRNTAVMFGQLRPTEVNMACRQVFSRNGFSVLAENPVIWSRSLAAPFALPSHVSLTVEGGADTEVTGGPA
jgi:FkbH-like protein